MSLLEQPTGQLRKYKPEELDEGLQKALKAIDEDIRKQESELDRLKTDSKVTKSDKEYKRENIKSRINELKEEKQSILFESTDQADWEFKTASFDPDNPATSDAMRRRSGASEGRRMRQQLAKERAKAKIAAGETSEVKTANIIKADGKWGELSNLSKHSFTWDGKEYNSVEHAYQTNKSGKFDKVTYQAYIDRPEALKIIGKHKADYGTNLELMEDLYRQMLNENPDMLKLLQETEGFEITHQLKKSDIWTKEMPKILTKLRDELKGETPETYKGKSSYTKAPNLKDLPGTLSFIDDTPPELKADLGLMYKMPPPLVDGVAKVGAKVWNQALKVLPIIDEEILIQAPSKILQHGLKGLGLGATAGAVGTATVAIGTYELYWMLINLGKAALNQAMGEAAEPGGVPPMLFSEHIELGENSEFSNAEQFMKDYEAWAKGSVAIQTFRGVTGHDDPIELMRAGFKKGEQGVNFYGYNMIKGLFGGNK